MDFDFLPNLPKSDLDDRKFQDLVDECLLRIPRYCPEWTNYNPSDPGVTLVELFAWMTDQMLARFNQVPRRNYVTFLELLGVRLRPPTPAKTEVTFYMSATLPENYTIPAGTEVATVRTEEEEAIVFSTDAAVAVGKPRIRHLLTAPSAEQEPQILRDRFIGSWRMERTGEWQGLELPFFDDTPEPGNCFYLVFDSESLIEGNVIALTLKGEAATSTGINPDIPPRRWEGWNGEKWQPILLHEADDKTQGFSFSEIVRQGGNPLSGADVVLHTPKTWPVTHFFTYQGRWIRCVYTQPGPYQAGYTRSPRIVGLSARSIGGSVTASQSTLIRNEILGESDGNPGQTFQIQGVPVLPRREEEYILVTPIGGLPQIWQEVNDFSTSGPEDLHYTLDSLTGKVQFGPLIREPTQLREKMAWRASEQGARQSSLTLANGRPGDRNAFEPMTATGIESMERQYGAVPPRGANIQIVSYRTGGGLRGNIQAGTIQIVKSAVPYVAGVINHMPGRGGADSESLDEAVIRAPRMLRTRDRAVTVEDFETLTLEAGQGAVARTLCLPPTHKSEAGIVRMLLVPKPDTLSIERGEGIDPDLFNLSPVLINRVLTYLDDRRLLGVQVQCNQPHYMGVSVQTEVALKPEYKNPSAQQQIIFSMQVALYRFLNPLTGGPDQTGWPFGRPVYPSDIVTILQNIPGVLYLGSVQLFELRLRNGVWVRSLPRDPVINPGPLGLVCSWRNDTLRSGHTISVI